MLFYTLLNFRTSIQITFVMMILMFIFGSNHRRSPANSVNNERYLFIYDYPLYYSIIFASQFIFLEKCTCLPFKCILRQYLLKIQWIIIQPCYHMCKGFWNSYLNPEYLTHAHFFTYTKFKTMMPVNQVWKDSVQFDCRDHPSVTWPSPWNSVY